MSTLKNNIMKKITESSLYKYKDVFLYLIVGGIATIVEWAAFYILDGVFSGKYVAATVIAYIISTFANWLAGRMIMFKDSGKGTAYELAAIYAASIVGLLLNVLIMKALIDIFLMNSMISKIIATILVFVWNYIIRKKAIYKHN